VDPGVAEVCEKEGGELDIGKRDIFSRFPNAEGFK